MIMDGAPALFLLQNLTGGEDLNVFGNGLSGGLEIFSNGTGCHGLHGHQCNDGPAGGVGDGLKYISS